MGSGGYSIPSIVEPDVIQFGQCNARFVLHVEKDTVWRRFNEDKFRRKHRCILTHGGGQPPRGVRRLLHRLHHELSLPVYCLLDNDPWGYYIYSVIKQGSINLAYESKRMAIPEAKYLGLRSIDYERCGLSGSGLFPCIYPGRITGMETTSHAGVHHYFESRSQMRQVSV